MKKIALALSALAALSVANAESISVLGLPLGGKLAHQVKQCPDDYKKRTSLCWLGKAFRSSDGAMTGTVSVPDKNLPKWVAYQLPNIVINAHGQLSSIRYLTSEALWRDRKEIVAGIAQRFGPAEEVTHRGVYTATWTPSKHLIQLGCINKACYLDMLTMEEVEAAEKRRQQEQQRPSTL